jgi:hypothetical protein
MQIVKIYILMTNHKRDDLSMMIISIQIVSLVEV